MKKRLLGISIITSIMLIGCTQPKEPKIPTTVAEMMDTKQVVGWKNYKEDSDKDGVLDIKDKCPNTPSGVTIDKDGCALDSDKDGIIDNFDDCPNTPLGVKVNSNGCALDSDNDGVLDYLDKCADTPEGLDIDINGCLLDNDNDGVADYYDKCFNTPKNVEVDDKGCPWDSDNDGIYDYLDKCPNTPKGLEVDRTGCPILASYSFNFALNSAKIDKKYYPQIEKLVDILKDNEKIMIEIQGYTDSQGSAEYNKKLSLRRAESLKNILVTKYKIVKNRIDVVGFGSDYPIADNGTEEGRAQNRRIIVIDKTKKVSQVPSGEDFNENLPNNVQDLPVNN